MSCCGNKTKSSLYTPKVLGQVQPVVPYLNQVQKPASDTVKEVYLEYIGKTGLTALGLVSGRRYRFVGNGSLLLVDMRDVEGLLRIPVLKRVKSS